MTIDSLVRRFYDRLWNAAAYDEAGAILSADLRFRGSLGTRADGVEGFCAYARGVRGALADYRCDIVELICAADGASAAARMRFSGAHVGMFLGVPPTGAAIDWDGAAFFRAERERLAEIWVLGDVDGLKQRLASARPALR